MAHLELEFSDLIVFLIACPVGYYILIRVLLTGIKALRTGQARNPFGFGSVTGRQAALSGVLGIVAALVGLVMFSYALLESLGLVDYGWLGW